MTKEIPSAVVCDIDGVLGDVTPGIVSAINKEFGTMHTREDWISWDWPVQELQLLSQMNIKDALNWLFSAEHYALSMPIPSAQEVLARWHEQGTNITVATSRDPASDDVTREWLSTHYPFIESHDIYVRSNNAISGSEHKIAVVEAVKPNFYFEDEPNMVIKLLARWHKEQLSILRVIDQPWNRNAQELDPFRTTWESFKPL